MSKKKMEIENSSINTVRLLWLIPLLIMLSVGWLSIATNQEMYGAYIVITLCIFLISEVFYIAIKKPILKIKGGGFFNFFTDNFIIALFSGTFLICIIGTARIILKIGDLLSSIYQGILTFVQEYATLLVIIAIFGLLLLIKYLIYIIFLKDSGMYEVEK